MPSKAKVQCDKTVARPVQKARLYLMMLGQGHGIPIRISVGQHPFYRCHTLSLKSYRILDLIILDDGRYLRNKWAPHLVATKQ